MSAVREWAASQNGKLSKVNGIIFICIRFLRVPFGTCLYNGVDNVI